MLEPVSRNTIQDVFGFHSVVASKFLDSYSVFDWGRMPDSIPHRGKFQTFTQALINLKVSSVEEWKKFLRSPDAWALRKAAPVSAAAHFNELADFFPMKTSHRGLISETNFNLGKMETLPLTTEMIQSSEPCYLLAERYAEEKIVPATVMGKTVWNFDAWKNKQGPKTLPFEFDCEFIEDFPKVTLRCLQNTFSTEISLTEALLITEFSPEQLQEVILRAVWIAGFTHFHLKTVTPIKVKKSIRIHMGMNKSHATEIEFVFLGTTIEFSEIETELQKYYSSTLWGKIVIELQEKARAKGYTDWKRYCSEPAPWLDPQLKTNFSKQYQKMILGIASCLSE